MTERQRIVKRLRQAQALGRLSEEVDALAAEIEKERRRKNGKHLVPDRKAQRRSERADRIREIREAVMLRANGLCEWCGEAGRILELHHVLMGNGTRRASESVETCAGICADCHRLLHRNGRAALILARTWAERGPYSVALAAIERRIAKVTP